MAAPELNPESTKAIADRLRRTREATGMTQAVFCRVVGIATPQWHNYENGLRRIALDPALKVCKATGVGLNWIYRGEIRDVPVNLAQKIQATAAERPGGRRKA